MWLNKQNKRAQSKVQQNGKQEAYHEEKGTHPHLNIGAMKVEIHHV